MSKEKPTWCPGSHLYSSARVATDCSALSAATNRDINPSPVPIVHDSFSGTEASFQGDRLLESFACGATPSSVCRRSTRRPPLCATSANRPFPSTLRRRAQFPLGIIRANPNERDAQVRCRGTVRARNSPTETVRSPRVVVDIRHQYCYGYCRDSTPCRNHRESIFYKGHSTS